jgi:hypothetical protein
MSVRNVLYFSLNTADVVFVDVLCWLKLNSKICLVQRVFGVKIKKLNNMAKSRNRKQHKEKLQRRKKAAQDQANIIKNNTKNYIKAVREILEENKQKEQNGNQER